jgi:hypothetical protein
MLGSVDEDILGTTTVAGLRENLSRYSLGGNFSRVLDELRPLLESKPKVVLILDADGTLSEEDSGKITSTMTTLTKLICC